MNAVAGPPVPSTAARRARAARARRAELAERRRALASGPRADVATVLALARLACVDAFSADVAAVRDGAAARVDGARPRELAGISGWLGAELAAAGGRLDGAFAAHTAPALRRLAARYCPGAPPLPLPEHGRSGADVLRAAAPPARPARPAGMLLSDPRVIGVLAGLPVLLAHGIGLPGALVAAGTVVLAGCVARARAVSDARALLRDDVARAVAAARAAGERELSRRLIEIEAAVTPALELAARERIDGGRDGAAGAGSGDCGHGGDAGRGDATG